MVVVLDREVILEKKNWRWNADELQRDVVEARADLTHG